MCLLCQFSSLSIEDQEDTQFPFAMRDLPPVSQRHTLGHQATANHQAEGSGTAANGRLPSSSSSPSSPAGTLSYHSAFQPASSPTVPPRPLRQLVSQVSVECPSSPGSRPQSPWCRFDPYDSPEVSHRRAAHCCHMLATLQVRGEEVRQSLCAFMSVLQDQDKEYVGFATLPNQVHRKTVKKGFTFTLMVAGEESFTGFVFFFKLNPCQMTQ